LSKGRRPVSPIWQYTVSITDIAYCQTGRDSGLGELFDVGVVGNGDPDLDMAVTFRCTYRCAAVLHFGPVLVVHCDAPIRLMGWKLFTPAAPDAPFLSQT
jgi:hypothetical protein